MRAALGAGRSRIARQMLTESLVLAFLGCGAGIGLAYAAVQNLARLGPAVFESRPPVIDGWVLLVAIAAVAVTTLLCGIIPAIRSTTGGLFDALRQSGRIAGGGGRTRRALTLAQFAIAVVLLTTSGLVTKSLARVLRVEPGFRTERLLYGDLWLPRLRYDDSRSVAFYAQLEDRLRATPGVVSVGMASQVPLSGYLDRIGISEIGGRPELRGSASPEADRYVVTPDYFTTMGITLLRGRLLSTDDRHENMPVAVVDEVFARRAFGREDPIGRTMKLPVRQEMATIVGVVTHVKTYGAEEASPGQIYMSNAQYPWRWLSVVVRTSGDPAAFAPTLVRVVHGIDAEQPVANMTTMDEALETAVRDRRFTVSVLIAFAGVALVLAAVGLYGVIAYGVTQRRRELGVRAALGAQSSELARMVMAEGGRLALAGAIIGMLGSLGAGRLLSTLLFEVRATDPTVLAGVMGGLLVTALLACLIPARRAAGVNASEVLRGD
jgi:putative ABC transport system permease protein